MEKIIDVTGIELKPGDPERCPGNGREDPDSCCCDECNYFLKCFPAYDTIKGLHDYEPATLPDF